MSILLQILTISALLWIAFQDFKDREIYWFLFPVVAICQVSFLIFFSRNPSYASLIVTNVLILIIIAIILFPLKKSLFCRNVRPGKKVIGWGDLLMLITLSSFLAPANFVLFLLAVSILALLVFLILQRLKVKNSQLVPFAGFLALGLAIIKISELFQESFNALDDNLLLSFLTNHLY